ncbi:heme lyase CcmF/NrfE family subunit [Actibacterium pelagium]|uniref:C-type cytochrome biogenesis protein CcmF n=1 Tax=Actibacterium pelagium TaxID=2029103 RepID=A0A917ABZ4_9RHOB|nr:heme lyase CcmF/NrfE family subunit [Actibacterium pelagium]GGE41542.1 c-type cytochrome biogenesis protein CcmF [Actibacterium pelagium]
MFPEIGHYALILAATVAVLQAVVPLIGVWRRDANLLAFAGASALVQLLFVGVSFAILARAFVLSDFSVLLVASHSNPDMPTHFRFSATWGNHEGSLLLWCLILAIFGAALALSRSVTILQKARILAVQGMIAVAFLSLVIFTSNPFERLTPAPLVGRELNPLLQDIGLVLHPPFLYLGYVGFSIVFSFSVAALIEGRVDALWARQVRPWVLSSWVFLTIGITLGSYWAYYELGWGGWWFWDPVENASFMPWLVGTALLHSVIVVERRQTLVVWTLLLAILTFSLSLLGTFVVRSGIITSVHAFASDPARGLWILGILALFTGGALTLFAARASGFSQTSAFRIVSREGGLVLNNILLLVATGTVLLGTFYPLLVELVTPEKISVGPPYFNRSFIPIMVPLMLALSVGAFLRWKRDRLPDALKRLQWVAVGVAALIVLGVAVFGFSNVWPVLALGLAAWLVLGAIAVLLARFQLNKGLPRAWQLARNTPPAVYGMVMAHAGLGLLVAGITAVSAWQEEQIVSLPIGGAVDAGSYTFTLDNVTIDRGPNYEAQQAFISVTNGDKLISNMRAERRFYPNSSNVTTEAAISPRFLTNLYASLGGPADGGQWVIRVYYHPLVLLIWFGPLLMSLGGVVSLADRRLRLGVTSGRVRTGRGVKA